MHIFDISCAWKLTGFITYRNMYDIYNSSACINPSNTRLSQALLLTLQISTCTVQLFFLRIVTVV